MIKRYLRAAVDGLAIIQRSELSAKRVIYTQNTWNDTLGDDGPALVVNDTGMNEAQLRELQSQQYLKVAKIAVGHWDGWAGIRSSFLFEGIRARSDETEENVVINKDLLVLWVHWVEWQQVLLDNGLRSLNGSLNEIRVRFDERLISVESLEQVVLWEFQRCLELVIPFTDRAWLKTVEVSESHLSAEPVWLVVLAGFLVLRDKP